MERQQNLVVLRMSKPIANPVIGRPGIDGKIKKKFFSYRKSRSNMDSCPT